ncbi:MAG: Do family serine endopeptidase [Lachnoclostridium sp.]|nr:Do family serine endopeptidase [Lachnoclostridium sp.]
MKLTTKIVLLSAASAVIGSGLTCFALKSAMSAPVELADNIVNHDAESLNAGYYKVSDPLTGHDADFTKAAESTINGVVSIKSFATPRSRYSGSDGGIMSDPFFEYFFGSPGRRQQPSEREEPRQQQTGLGSGVIISEDGYIVTNNHVVEDAERLEITLNDNRTFDATVIGSDSTTDLALIKIDASDLPVIPMGDSESLKVGEWVLAVGNPFGFTSTVTTGIVSAKARSIGSVTHSRPMGIESYIQTDAAVNPGNSGGALVNLNGELIGINTAIYSQTGNYAGYSFAIPTSIVKKVVGDIRQFGAVQRAVLGVSISDLTNELAKKHDIKATTKGVFVAGVVDRSSAMEAGIKEGDVITAINGVNTDNVAQLQEQVAKYRPGDKISVTYLRDNKSYTTDVKLLNNHGTTTVTKPGTFDSLGAEFAAIDDDTRSHLRISSGVKVVDVSDGKFRDAGVQKGFIITSVNRIAVKSASDIEKIYKSVMKSDDDEKLLILRGIYPSGKAKAYLINLAED